MANPATADDLVSRWRPLSDQETTNGETFLDDAWRMLKRRHVPDVEARLAATGDDADPDLEGEVIRVLCAAVLRVMKNPDGKRKEAIDDYSWERDQALSAGLLYFTDDEIDDLTLEPAESGPAFSFSLLGSNYPESRFPDDA